MDHEWVLKNLCAVVAAPLEVRKAAAGLPKLRSTGFCMKHRSKNALIFFLFTVALGLFFLLGTEQTFCADDETEIDENDPLLNKLLVAGCVVGVAVVLILVITQVRGKWQRQSKQVGRSANRKAMSARTMAFRCRECGKVFKEELSKERKIECPLCGHVWRWPPPIQLKLLADRMSAFALDLENPRGDLTLATKVISRLSKGFAERMLVAGRYLESGEMLCICGQCREIHITEKKNRGLLGVCGACKSVLLIW